jgi:hypothetical protein
MSDVSFHSLTIEAGGTTLACYRAETGPREVVGYRTCRGIAVYDLPAGRVGSDAYEVDRGAFFWEDALASFVLDYVEQSERWGYPAAAPQVRSAVCQDLAQTLMLEARRVCA